jgi:hypothetical protein
MARIGHSPKVCSKLVLHQLHLNTYWTDVYIGGYATREGAPLLYPPQLDQNEVFPYVPTDVRITPKRTLVEPVVMSALCQKRTFKSVTAGSTTQRIPLVVTREEPRQQL